MTEDNPYTLIADAQAAHFAGWDFSYLDGRWWEEPPPWDYRRIVQSRFSQIDSLLDMGTGGGELLAEFSTLPPKTFATEAYAPNVPVARALLEPRGVQVVEFDDDHHLPFPDHSFELIINRHESYAPDELRRILSANGRFISQQVGGRDNWDLNELLGAEPPTDYAHWDLSFAERELVAAGFQIVDSREAHTCTVFRDVGAVVYYLNAIPWQIPDFSVERYRDRLLRLHSHIRETGELRTHSSRFLIEAVRG